MPSSEQILEKYLDTLAADVHPRYELEVRRFLEYTKGNVTPEALGRYIKHLQANYSTGTIVKIVLPTIRKLYRVNGLPLELKKGDTPKLGEKDVYAPALDPDDVKTMIQASKSKKVDKLDRAYLVLSTVYGMRRVELNGVSNADVDLDNKTLYVETAKHGRERWHTIPDNLLDYLDVRFRKHDVSQVSKAWYRLEEAAGLSHEDEVAWHSVRRILVRLLVQADVPAPIINLFLRWKRGGDDDMQKMYYSTTVVSHGKTKKEVGKVDQQSDERVFSVHPFLKEW